MKLDFSTNSMATEIRQVIEEVPDMTRDSDHSEVIKPTKRKAKAKKSKNKKKKAKYEVSSSESSSSEESEESDASESD